MSRRKPFEPYTDEQGVYWSSPTLGIREVNEPSDAVIRDTLHYLYRAYCKCPEQCRLHPVAAKEAA